MSHLPDNVPLPRPVLPLARYRMRFRERLPEGGSPLTSARLAPATVRVRLLSPLRIKRHEHLVGAANFDFRAFMSGLLRRISLLTCFFSDTPLETDFACLLRMAESAPVTRPEVRWREWIRHSSRQNTKLQMGGLVGSFELAGSKLEPFWPILWLGQWTHAGKGCSMGLGRYVLEPVRTDSDHAGEERDAVATPNGTPWPAPLRI